MQVEVQAIGMDLPTSTYQGIKNKLLHTFDFAKQKVRKVDLRVFREESAGAGLITCRVHALVMGVPNVVIESQSPHVHIATKDAINNAYRAVLKHIDRKRSGRRKLLTLKKD